MQIRWENVIPTQTLGHPYVSNLHKDSIFYLLDIGFCNYDIKIECFRKKTLVPKGLSKTFFFLQYPRFKGNIRANLRKMYT